MAYPVSGGVYSWAVSSPQNTASTVSALISVCGLIAVYILLNLINNASDEAGHFYGDIVDEYLINHEGNITQGELSYCAFLLATLPKPIPHQPRESFAAVINLMISFGLGLTILVVLSAIAIMCYPRRAETQEETFEQRRASRGYRLLTLGFMLRRYHVRLKADDGCDVNPDDAGDGQARGWMIPKPGIPSDEIKGEGAEEVADSRRVLFDKCAICLDTYNAGEKVAYSSNPNCVHAFHESCILSWMLPQASGSQQCPCCRQTFLQDCPEVTKKVY